MILTRDTLRRMAARRRLNLGALEKEYVLDLVLRSLSAHETLREILVLKGGTALHRFYLGTRLSLDLDFTATKPVTLDEVQPALEITDVGATIAEYQPFHDALTIRRLRYVGPLGHPNSVKVDFSFREPLLLPPVDLISQAPYGDPFPLRVMQLAEIAAEKIRALSMREATRDVYDLWAIATRQLVDARVVAQLVPHKMETVHLALNLETLERHLGAVEAVWVSELRLLMADVPGFSQVAGALRPWLSAILARVTTSGEKTP